MLDLLLITSATVQNYPRRSLPHEIWLNMILQHKVYESEQSPSSTEFPQIRNYSTRYGEAKRFSCSTSHVFKDPGPGGGMATGKKSLDYMKVIFLYMVHIFT